MVPIVNDLALDDFIRKKHEYRELKLSIKDKIPLTFLIGRRGTGKTSLIKQIIDENIGVMIDLLKYSNKKNFRRSYFVDELEIGLQNHKKFSRLHPFLKNLDGVKESKHGLILDKQLRKLDPITLFSLIDTWSKKVNRQFILAIDDAFYLTKFQHLNFENFFAYVIDNFRNISIILASQNEDQLRKACNFDDSKAPLFGRSYKIIQLKELDFGEKKQLWSTQITKNNLQTKKAHQFFEQFITLPGFLDVLMPFISEVSGTVDVPDVLSLLRNRSEKHARATFENFLQNRNAKEKYLQIIFFLSKGPSNWKKIKDYLELELGEKLYDKNFNELLDHLEENEFIKNRDGMYIISNPFLESHFQSFSDARDLL